MSAATVVVTGAGGFIGSAVVRQLLGAGYRVRSVLRDVSKSTNLTGLDTEVVAADICDRPAVDRALDGMRFVVHVAADYRLWAADPKAIWRNNVGGTTTVMEAALDAGVERIVYTSSVATLAARADGQPADESAPLAERDAVGAYKQSKVAAERVALAMVKTRGLPAVIVNPSTPIGPRDARPTPTGRVIVDAARGRIPAFVDTGLNLVHVDDVAAGHVAALKRGIVGERYILGGQNVTLAALLADIARAVGRSPPTIRLPRRLLFPLAWLAEAMAALTGREPLLTADGLRMASTRMFFTAAKAERELGYRARPYAEALDDAIQWYRANGQIA